MRASNQWRVRQAVPEDRAFLEEIAPRLTIGIAPWIDPTRMLTTMRGYLLFDLEKMEDDSTVFIAVGEDDKPVGVATVNSNFHFTDEPQAYLGELAVREEVEGQGVASALLEAVELWARRRGLPWIALETGSRNTRARDFYARHGYEEESVRLVKPLSE
ncbi:MAG TPA: GNAT family N-acetyltransferase [Ktedonobacterales bacterium]